MPRHGVPFMLSLLPAGPRAAQGELDTAKGSSFPFLSMLIVFMGS